MLQSFVVDGRQRICVLMIIDWFEFDCQLIFYVINKIFKKVNFFFFFNNQTTQPENRGLGCETFELGCVTPFLLGWV